MGMWRIVYMIKSQDEGVGYIYQLELDTYDDFVKGIQDCIREGFEIIEATQC